MIAWVRHKHDIPAPAPQSPAGLTVRQLARKFAVSVHVIYYWLGKGLIAGQRLRPEGPMRIALTEQQDHDLRAWVINSKRIAKPVTPEVLKEIASCAV
jgi:hypothetical protein